MPQIVGHLRKMAVALQQPVEYQFYLDSQQTNANQLIGKKINLSYLNQIQCVSCGRSAKKSFQNGHCYPCFRKLAACDTCILKPELCHFHQGTCREPEWGQNNCFIPHIVYLANTSGLKVGITRETQVPIRWIDQGAISALPIIRVQSRYQSGLIEVEIAKHVADKTNWRNMLKGNTEKLDLTAERNRLLPEVSEAIQQISSQFDFGNIELLTNEKVVEISYPVTQYPEKISSFNFDKDPHVEGVLQGIKGQYLILDTGVINLRKFTGYQVEISW